MLLLLTKRLLNEKKVPCIPLIFDDNKFIVDFKEKSEADTFLQNSLHYFIVGTPHHLFKRGGGGGVSFRSFRKKRGAPIFSIKGEGLVK